MNSCLKAYASTQNSSSLMELWSTTGGHTVLWLHAFVNNTQSIKFRINSWVLHYFVWEFSVLGKTPKLSPLKKQVYHIHRFSKKKYCGSLTISLPFNSIQLIHKEDMGRGPMCNGNATQFLEVGWLQLLEFCFNDPVLITLLTSQCADAWEDCNIFYIQLAQMKLTEPGIWSCRAA